MRNKEEVRLQRVVAIFCATLFALFSFFFVAKFQAPSLELFYDHVSTGKLQYNAYIAGAVVSLVLTLFALWLNRYTGFRREWTALSYLPSALLLSFITDIDRSLYTEDYNYGKWVIIFFLGALFYAAFSFVLRRILFAKIKNIAMSANRILWRNLQIFVILFCIVGFFANSEENFKREALVASYYKKGKIDKALNVGYRSRVASRHLTAQRAYILAENGLLGEKLFEYPQPYASEGLLPVQEHVSPLVADSVYTMLGVVPATGEKAADVFKRAVESDTSSVFAKEYYLSALLLERRIVEFVNTVKEFYPDGDTSSLPKHYKEALMLYESIDNNASVHVDDPEMKELFKTFKAMEGEYDDSFVRGNYIRRHFGRTYWWYFLYGNM